MTAAAPLRVASIGAGYFSRFHRDAWARSPRARVVAVCDRDMAAAEATGLPAFDDPARMLDATRPDLLDIILPPAGHGATIRAGLAAGVRAIICQKPFCIDLAEAEEMTALAEAAGIPLIVHENFRFQPWYRAIRGAMDEGLIGDPLQLTFRLRPGDGQGPEAYLDRQPYFQRMERFLVHETAVHWIDTFRFLLGTPTAVYADLRRINPVIAGEDAGYILFDHPGGVRSLFDGNRHLDHASDNPRRTMGEALIEGTRGTLALSGDGAVTLRAFAATRTREVLPPDTWEGFGGDCVKSLQDHVVSGLLEGQPFENPARDYLDVLRMRDAVYRAAETGRKEIL